MTNQFKRGDKIRCVDAYGWGGITNGNVYEVVGMSGGLCVHLLKDDDGKSDSKPYAHRFELLKAEPKFKVGDKVRNLKDDWPELTIGKVYTIGRVRDNAKELGPDSGGFSIQLAELMERHPQHHRYETHFELVNCTESGTEQQISTEFEIRWHKTPGKLAQPIGVTDGRVLARRASQQLAEDFITQNAGNYAAGEFSITQVTVLKRIQQVRRVKRVPVTTYKLEDA
ncbi:hypothetical protein RVY52_006975 [Burkholderia cenocepacia]|nr:hypothetical protein [Burkholderia cenocepacia]